MGLDGISPIAIVVPALNVAYRTGKTAFELASVGDQARQLLGTIEQVRSDIEHARRLRRWKEKAMSAHEKSTVDATIKSTEEAVRRVQELVESARLDISTNWGKISSKTRVMWVLDGSNKVGTTLALLNAHNTTLNREITLMSLKDGVPFEDDDDDDSHLPPLQPLRRKTTLRVLNAAEARETEEGTQPPPPSYQQATMDMLHKRRQSYRRRSVLYHSVGGEEEINLSLVDFDASSVASVPAAANEAIATDLTSSIEPNGARAALESDSSREESAIEGQVSQISATLNDFREYSVQSAKMISPMIKATTESTAPRNGSLPVSSDLEVPMLPNLGSGPSEPHAAAPSSPKRSQFTARPKIHPKLFNTAFLPGPNAPKTISDPTAKRNSSSIQPPPKPKLPANPFDDEFEIPEQHTTSEGLTPKPLSKQLTGDVAMSSRADLSGHSKPMVVEWLEPSELSRSSRASSSQIGSRETSIQNESNETQRSQWTGFHSLATARKSWGSAPPRMRAPGVHPRVSATSSPHEGRIGDGRDRGRSWLKWQASRAEEMVRDVDGNSINS